MIHADIILELYDLIVGRKLNPLPGSYTSKLLLGGLNSIAKKLGEEVMEVVMAAKDGSKEAIIHEAADVIYHLMVLLAYEDVDLRDVLKELKRRRKQG